MRARFGVDADLCIGCGLCHERAPRNVQMPPGEAYAVVVKQPGDDAEEAALLEASYYCPTGGLQRVRTPTAEPRGALAPPPAVGGGSG